MTDKFHHRIEHQRKIGNRFYTQEVTDFRCEATWDNINQATSYETLKWFRKIGSKQRVTRTVKNGKYVVTIFSYAPHDERLRNKIIFEEV